MMNRRHKQFARMLDAAADQPRAAPRIRPLEVKEAQPTRGFCYGMVLTLPFWMVPAAFIAGRPDMIVWGAALAFGIGSIAVTIRNRW